MSINNPFYGLTAAALADLHHAVLNDIESAECVPGVDMALVRECVEYAVSMAVSEPATDCTAKSVVK